MIIFTSTSSFLKKYVLLLILFLRHYLFPNKIFSSLCLLRSFCRYKNPIVDEYIWRNPLFCGFLAEVFLRIYQQLASLVNFFIGSVRLQNMGFYIICKLNISNMLHFFFNHSYLLLEIQFLHAYPNFLASNPQLPMKICSLPSL